MPNYVEPDFSEKAALIPGTYRAKVVGYEVRQGEYGPSTNWKFEVQSNHRGEQGVWVFGTTSLSGKGAQLLKSLYRAAVKPDYESGKIDLDLIKGQTVIVRTEDYVKKDGTKSAFLKVVDVSADNKEFQDDIPF